MEEKTCPQLDKYTMISVIGKGGYAKVVLVRNKEDNKVYAMKMLKKKFIGNFFIKSKNDKLSTQSQNVMF